jgi:hypothetical protein
MGQIILLIGTLVAFASAFKPYKHTKMIPINRSHTEAEWNEHFQNILKVNEKNDKFSKITLIISTIIMLVGIIIHYFVD